MRNNPDLFLTDAEHRAALAITRSLGRKGLKIHASGHYGKSQSFYSKYCDSFSIYPEIQSGVTNVHKSLIHNVKKYRPRVLMPLLDNALLAVYKYQDIYQRYTKLIPMVPYDDYLRLNDKSCLHEFAIKNNLPMPKTYPCRSLKEAKKFAGYVGYPLIIKPKVSNAALGAYLLKDKGELINKFKQLKKHKTIINYYDTKEIIAQEYIPNTVSFFNVLMINGKIVAKHHMKILSTYPSPCGSSASSISIYNEQLDLSGLRVLKKIGVRNGTLNIQFIYDKNEKTYKLLEINPRIWGSIQTSIEAGVNFPFILWKAAIGEKVIPINYYNTNKEVKHILSEIKLSLLRPRLMDIINLLKIRKASTEFDLNDIQPNIIQIINEIYNLARIERLKRQFNRVINF